MAKVLVCETISDWFHTVEKDINPEHYDKMRLVASEMVWTLEGLKDGIVQERWQVEQPKKVMRDFDINELIGNRYRNVHELLA